MRAATLSLLLSVAAGAQEPPSAPPPPPASEVEGADAPAVEGQAPTPEERLTPGLHDFLSEFLTYDEEKGDAYIGRERRPLPRVELYHRLGRPDLAARVEVLAHRRRLFFIVGGVSAVAGLVVGALGFGGAPDLNSEACVADPEQYNACAASYRTHQVVGAVGLATALTAAVVFIGTGAAMDLEPLPHDEAQQLVSQHNRELLRKGKAGGARRAPIHLLPVLTAHGAGLATAISF